MAKGVIFNLGTQLANIHAALDLEKALSETWLDTYPEDTSFVRYGTHRSHVNHESGDERMMYPIEGSEEALFASTLSGLNLSLVTITESDWLPA